jgi:hypothetical protein
VPATIHISFNAVSFSAAILYRARQSYALAPNTRRDIEEKAIMIDQETSFPVTQGTASQQDGIADAIAAIIVITRREWLSPARVALVPGDATVNRAGTAHPLIRFALDGKRAGAWRARAARRRWLGSVENIADVESAG